METALKVTFIAFAVSIIFVMVSLGIMILRDTFGKG